MASFKPANYDVLEKLFIEKDDLYLVWPKAKFPFDRIQWEEQFKTNEDYTSLLFTSGEQAIGHVALQKNADIVAISFCYVIPNLRSNGIGEKIVSMAEKYSIENFKPKHHRLVVRTYNPSAFRCYEKLGFLKIGQEDTLIKMEKKIELQ